MFDIDIDFADRNVLLEKLKHRIAKLENGKKHNTGVYFTEIPHDPATNLSTLDYETAEDRNYFKIGYSGGPSGVRPGAVYNNCS